MFYWRLIGILSTESFSRKRLFFEKQNVECQNVLFFQSRFQVISNGVLPDGRVVFLDGCVLLFRASVWWVKGESGMVGVYEGFGYSDYLFVGQFRVNREREFLRCDSFGHGKISFGIT